MTSTFTTGVRPAIDAYLADKAAQKRDYGDYWSASSAGYCMRKLIFERLGVPVVQERDERTMRVFEAGHIFHEFFQRITREAGISVAQELELQDEDLMIRGHFDDLILVDDNLILYDYKTQNSRAFSFQKGRPISHFHKMQLGTYMYMLRKQQELSWEENVAYADVVEHEVRSAVTKDLVESRILKISKDDLRMDENVLLWTPDLEKEVVGYWSTLNGYWKNQKLPNCTCADHEGGFMAKEKYNPFFFEGEPCSLEWYKKFKEESNG